jgi:hypothetical protein
MDILSQLSNPRPTSLTLTHPAPEKPGKMRLGFAEERTQVNPILIHQMLRTFINARKDHTIEKTEPRWTTLTLPPGPEGVFNKPSSVPAFKCPGLLYLLLA